MKRFYKQVAAGEVANGFGVTLDGRRVKTPAGRPMSVPAERLAVALAQEWQEQEDLIRPDSMKLTQLVSTALDRIPETRSAVLGYLAGFGESDLLCYRALHPADLVERQAVAWQPLLDWAEEVLSARLTVTAGVVPVGQPAGSLAALRQKLETYDDWILSALQAVVPALGSLILGLALIEGRLAAAEAFDLAQLDETFQVERWGSDAEAVKRREGLRREVAAAARFLLLIRAPSP